MNEEKTSAAAVEAGTDVQYTKGRTKGFRIWIIAFAAWICLVLAGIAVFNYVGDPYGYFTFLSGEYEDIDFSYDLSSVAQRVLKAKDVIKYGDQ